MSIEFKSTNDQWVKCISSSGTIRAVAINAPEICTLLSKKHQYSDIATIALSEGIIASLLLSSYCKSGEKVNLNIQAQGWCHQAIFDANADAEVRGYVIERPQSDFDLPPGIGPWGLGLMSVLRTKVDQQQPYIGTVPLITGRLPKDLTFYWHQSEQVQSAVGIEVVVENNQVVAAEGFLIQALPGSTEDDLKFIEKHLKELNQHDIDSNIRKSPLNLLAYFLENQTFSVVEEKNLTLKCSCSIERVKRSLMLIATDEIQSMIDDKKDFNILCDFCSENYCLTTHVLSEIKSMSQK